MERDTAATNTPPRHDIECEGNDEGLDLSLIGGSAGGTIFTRQNLIFVDFVG